MQPQLIIIAGANGSGKTTFAKPYVEELGFQFLNADEIAKELDEAGEQNTMVKAGRIFFAKLNKCLADKENFVVETTLSGSYINKVAKKAKDKGYLLQIIYIFLEHPNICIDRVRSRVIKGGHDVPIDAIIRRYYRSKNNFWTAFLKITDDWLLYYNGEEGFQQVATGSFEEFSIENAQLFNLFKTNMS